jgi:epoxide hydrolase-like predicted phosphatase
MTTRALIFDVGGVLLRVPAHTQQHLWEQQFGLAPGAIDRALWGTELSKRATLGQIEPDEVWSQLGPALGLSAEQVAFVRTNYFTEEYLDPAMEAFLRSLRPHYRLTLLTNAWLDVRPVLTKKFPLGRLVDEIVISAEVGLAKPDPAIYRLTLAQLGVAPDEALFIDDKLRNVEAAKALGIRSIHFRDARKRSLPSPPISGGRCSAAPSELCYCVEGVASQLRHRGVVSGRRVCRSTW